jgi:hypothetical protein
LLKNKINENDINENAAARWRNAFGVLPVVFVVV